MTAAQIAAAVRAGTLDPEAVVSAALERLADGAHLNAVITTCAERALARARAGPRGRLAGVPVLVKDLIDTAGVRTTYASSIYADHVPARSATAVTRLEAEGAIVVGKANADEFAWGVCGQNAHWGDVVNPRAPGRIAGGSSAGNAAALAGGLVPLAIGTDTGGSVRLPAAACGVVGFKPAWGDVPVDGVHPLVPSYDTVGPMARTAGDCAVAAAVLAGVPAVAEGRGDLRGLRVGVLTAPPSLGAADGGSPAVDERALEPAATLEALGADVAEVTLPVPAGDTWPVFYAEAAAAHRATFPSRRDDYGPTVRAKLDAAQGIEPAVEARARRALEAWRRAAVDDPAVDLVLSPTLGFADLPPAGADELELRIAFSAYTRPFSSLGWPAIALGEVQLAGRRASLVLEAALALEGATTDSR